MLPSLEEIIRKRKVLNLTQKQVSQLAGVSQSLIAKLESGKIDPSYTKVKAILDVLDRLETKAEVIAPAGYSTTESWEFREMTRSPRPFS